MFTLPKVYETNKQNIDQYLDLVRSKIVEITDKWVFATREFINRYLIASFMCFRVKAAIPIGGAKKEESDKDK